MKYNNILKILILIFYSLMEFIGLYGPIKTDEKTKNKIINLCMIKDNESNKLYLDLTFINPD